ncbi:MAG: hypothetical protein RSB59_00900 [Clostridia bacterium]
MMKKISSSDMKEVSKMFAEIFSDYPLYKFFFQDNQNPLQKCIYYYFRFSIFERKTFTYVSEDKTCAAIVQSPKDKKANFLPLLVRNGFFGRFYHVLGKNSIKVWRAYSDFSKKARAEVMQVGDYYIKSIGVVSSARGRGLMHKMIDELCGNAGIVLETHDTRNISLYENIGFKLVQTLDFRGNNHYLMRREAIN